MKPSQRFVYWIHIQIAVPNFQIDNLDSILTYEHITKPQKITVILASHRAISLPQRQNRQR